MVANDPSLSLCHPRTSAASSSGSVSSTERSCNGAQGKSFWEPCSIITDHQDVFVTATALRSQWSGLNGKTLIPTRRPCRRSSSSVEILQRKPGSGEAILRVVLLHPRPHVSWKHTQQLLQDDDLPDLLLAVLLWPDPATVEALQAVVCLSRILPRWHHSRPELLTASNAFPDSSGTRRHAHSVSGHLHVLAIRSKRSSWSPPVPLDAVDGTLQLVLADPTLGYSLRLSLVQRLWD
ncbi:uncharacterized protein LOC111948943 [Oryzias latipes]|uniref:uncharacterized protein LOC111948943 n=1 Tax=Oryzias latipes TaxID=8090 RepID=UPI000CE202F2|nr:uncharacterized protein LOC111948943 [Oryzias latipes]